MKGLMMQDFMIFKNQKILWIILLGLSIFYIIADMSIFMISFGSIFLAMFAIKTIYLELEKNIAPFLFTLPFSKGQYVWEKYFISIGFPMIYGILLALICFTLNRISLQEACWAVFATFGSVGFMASLLIPLSIRFKDKATLVSIGMAGAFWLAISWISLDELEKFNFLRYYSTYFEVALPIAFIIFLSLSICLSLKWIQKEEF